MSNIALLVGNSSYSALGRLDCCSADVDAMRALLHATQKYDRIEKLENLTADNLKAKLRACLDGIGTASEVFFYFSGHGFQSESDFYLCATNFDGRRPNETGLSTLELHTLLKLADAELVVKVIDACNSGTLLVKSNEGWLQSKDGFRNVIQIASCLDSQNSFAGDPLSLFTDRFRSAALRKPEGIVYYTDVINTLRDEFLSNNIQTPFFVSQQTGREQFVDDAHKLDDLRTALASTQELVRAEDAIDQLPVTRPQTLSERLAASDRKMVRPEVLDEFVNGFFDRLIANINASEFSDFFELDIAEHEKFEERTAYNFMIRVLSNEKRPDNFVTASYSRTRRKTNPIYGVAFDLMQRYIDDDAYSESWELELNCAMRRAQIRITFTPKFNSLKRIVLVVSCAPSLDNCYIFEMGTQHLLRDFGKFDETGSETSRRWWKLRWDQSTHGVEEQISQKLLETVRAQLEDAEGRLAQPET